MKGIRHTLIGASVAVLAMSLAVGCGQKQSSNSDSGLLSVPPDQANLKTTSQTWSSPPKMTIDPSKQYDAVVHTNIGNFTIQLLAKDSPKTVNNFVFLAKHHFYKNDAFFRVIQSFMIQTGDPNNIGTGGPGYKFKDELPNQEKYAPGVVAMANAGPNTNGSQFFIGTGQEVSSLNSQPNYTIFGKVTKGMDVVTKIAAIPVEQNPITKEQNSYPTETAYITSIDIQTH